MGKILVAGLINIETTVQIGEFPVEYVPVQYPFFGVRSTVSGVGYNIARALTTLGHSVELLSMTGSDFPAAIIRQELEQSGISTKKVLPLVAETPQSAILYDTSGKRMIYTDLKNVQDTLYPLVHLDLTDKDLAVLCNINFSRPMLERAKQAGIPIATDVHTMSDLEDAYNREYMAAADILFMSDERLPCAPEEWARRLQEHFGTAIIVIGMGARGALLAVKAHNMLEVVPAHVTRPIINTIGAGDALFSSFLHGYLQTRDPLTALQHAVIFAGYKIGTTGAAEGFLTAQELAQLVEKTKKERQ
jgi:ribokinase